jgi:hypothetical protein
MEIRRISNVNNNCEKLDADASKETTAKCGAASTTTKGTFLLAAALPPMIKALVGGGR